MPPSYHVLHTFGFQESDEMAPAKPTRKKLYREKISDSRKKRAAAMLEECDDDVSYKINLWTPTNASISHVLHQTNVFRSPMTGIKSPLLSRPERNLQR